MKKEDSDQGFSSVTNARERTSSSKSSCYEKDQQDDAPSQQESCLRNVTLERLVNRVMKTDVPNYLYYFSLRLLYRITGRPCKTGETYRARERRLREGFFDKYCQGKGLDIGYGGDLLASNCIGYDFEHGDAQYLNGIADESFDFVYSSHTLEHMDNPAVSLSNWWRVVKRGGYLLLYIPHRDLYEKKITLPSRWSSHHKHYFLLDKSEEPCTIGIIPLIEQTLSGFKLIYEKVCDEGHTIVDPEKHSDGEYSIEVAIKKIR